jgi:dienelactone hydrolase
VALGRNSMQSMRRTAILVVSLCVIVAAPGQALAWRGHSWERWREISGATTRPAVTSPQAGEKELLELLRTAGPDSPRITSVAGWEAKQARIRRVLEAFLGTPGHLAKPRPEAVTLDETTAGDHIRRHIRIRCEPDDWIPAYLLIPRSAPPGPGPVIIVLHQTVPQGKDEPAGVQGDPQLAIARELVSRGYLCLVPDVIGFGERLPEGATRRVAWVSHGVDPRGLAPPEAPKTTGINPVAHRASAESVTGQGTDPGHPERGGPTGTRPNTRPPAATQPASREPYDNIAEFFERHPHWSVMGKMNWDVSRCIDYLETLPQIDRKRIGCIGHSHGAYGTIFAVAFDPRIAAAAASCGFNTLRTDPRPDRWCRLTPLLPAMGFYVSDRVPNAGERPGLSRPGTPDSSPTGADDRQLVATDIPFDWHEICSLIAPRPFLYWGTLNDSIFPNTDNLTWVFGQLGEVYALYGAGDRLAWKLAPGEHRFPDEARTWAYEWFDRQLRPKR